MTEKTIGSDSDNGILVNILVTSISKKVPLIKSVKKACRKLGNSGKIFGADSNKDCIARYFVDDFWEMPQLAEIDATEIIEFCKQKHIVCIIPTRDGELRFFARHKQLFFENGIHVMVSGEAAVEACQDKLLFFQKAAAMGFPVIQTVTDINDLVCGRYVVKQRFGAGSVSIGVNLSKAEATAHGENLENAVYQPFIDGKEFSVDVYVDMLGKAKGAIVRSRDLVINGESQVTTTICNRELESLSISLAEKFQIYGHAVLQVIIDDVGEFHIIECNCRFGGASTLSLEAGLDSFCWFLLESLGVDISRYPFIRSAVEKKQIRYAEDIVIP